MKKGKRWLACILAVVLTVTLLPASSIVAHAADMTGLRSSLYVHYENVRENDDVRQVIHVNETKVEVGEKVELAYLFYYEKYYESLHNNGGYSSRKQLSEIKKGVSYQSSDTQVATVSKTGVLTPKKVGTADIKISYKGQELSIPLTVVKKGKLKLNKYKSAENWARKMAAVNPKKLTKANRYQVLKMYYKSIEKVYINGCLEKKDINDPKEENIIVAPTMAKAENVRGELYEMFDRKNPTYVGNKGAYQIKSIKAPKAGAKSFTITLKKKVTADQIFYMKANEDSRHLTDPYVENNLKNDGKANFCHVICSDAAYTDEAYTGWVHVKLTFTEGSDKVKATLYSKKEITKLFGKNGEDARYVANYSFFKFVKGTYYLGFSDNDVNFGWSRAKKFVVK